MEVQNLNYKKAYFKLPLIYAQRIFERLSIIYYSVEITLISSYNNIVFNKLISVLTMATRIK